MILPSAVASLAPGFGITHLTGSPAGKAAGKPGGKPADKPAGKPVNRQANRHENLEGNRQRPRAVVVISSEPDVDPLPSGRPERGVVS